MKIDFNKVGENRFMLFLENAALRVQVCENGTDLTVTDKLRDTVWVLDPERMRYAPAQAAQDDCPMLPESAACKDGALKITYTCGKVSAVYEYRLSEDYAEVTLAPFDESDGMLLPLPGSFTPASGAKKYLLPIMQGMLWDTKGEPFDERYAEAAHGGFSMAMFGCIAEKGALLTVAETADDCLWNVGKDETGSWAVNLQAPSLGELRYERRIRLYITEPSVTAVAKRYRRRVMERGRFQSWEEKLRERPSLERLFGALMCFVGYCQDELDYAAECEKLKAYGFDRVLLYPMRFSTYSKGFLMGGQPPVALDRETVARIKELGYDVAPWTWINEGLDDGSEEMRLRYRVNADGQRRLGWQIDEHKWYTCCNGSMPAFQKAAAAGEMSDMTWDHFDVITCVSNGECYALDHESHYGRPLSRTEDREFIRRLLLEGQAGGTRAVSSESFNDAYSLEYDLGSVKAWPQYGPWPFRPVPLTMLVYHDSMLHTWWEPHNYNTHYFNRDAGKYQYGGGRPRLMATMDALYGSLPDVFPFGAMYGWTGNGQETFLFKKRFEDPETQFALSLAKPVAELHRKIGKMEMTEFHMMTEDGTLQKTVFSDGTAVYANFSQNVSKPIDGVGALQPESWLCVDGK